MCVFAQRFSYILRSQRFTTAKSFAGMPALASCSSLFATGISFTASARPFGLSATSTSRLDCSERLRVTRPARTIRVTSRDMVDASPGEQISMKGISRPIVPYMVRGVLEQARDDTVITETDEGMSLTLDTAGLDPARGARLRDKLQSALAQLEAKLAVPSPKGFLIASS